MNKQEFLWGSASSGPQSEGFFDKCNKSIWDEWFIKEPQRFHNYIGPDKTCDVYNNYATDAKLMQEIGLNSFRTSIQWTRVISNFETGEICQDGIEFYREYFKSLNDAGVKVIVNLFHYDMPFELHEQYGGFLSREVVDKFVEYAKVCFDHFDDQVYLWTTFNEPMAYAKEMYHDNRIFPCELDFDKMMLVNYNVVYANALCKQLYASRSYKQKMGIILDCQPSMPRSTRSADLEAANIADLLTNKIYLNPCILGEYSADYFDFIKDNNIKVNILKADLEVIKNNTMDFVGINYYRPTRVKAPTFLPNPKVPMQLDHFFEKYDLPNCRMNNYRGWEIYPKAIYDIGVRIKDEYNNIEWFISENGMGVEDEERFRDSAGIIQDDYRIEFIKEHLYWLKKTRDEGSNCFGYHTWTFIDNWSWLNAFKNRYGYVEYNLTTGERKRKASSYWIEELIKNEYMTKGDNNDINQ
ncbi:glycoside hydrolase family 1 protein [Mollicutes bacterium LVI A0039]|nr:glycoside hydrolase family 1 protein [Mollicutes bacterium LVI A0039]